MSWIEQIQSDLVITCGDGKGYKPNWVVASKEVEYNIAVFAFSGLAGELVHRGTPKGTRYSLEVFFQGDNHLDVSAEFENSSADPKPWTIAHPYYGTIIVQPTGWDRNNDVLNISKYTIQVIETIQESAPRTSISPVDKIVADKASTDELLAQTYANDVSQPKISDVNEMKTNAAAVYNKGAKVIKNTEDANAYYNAFSKANNLINSAIINPLQAIRQIQTMINMPSQFIDSVKNRVKMLLSQLEQLGNTIANITGMSSKKLYENNAGTIIGAAALASVTNASYTTRTEALDMVNTLLTAHNTYMANLDLLQTDNGGNPDSYIPDDDSLTALSSLISYTVSTLFDMAAEARQERSFYLEEDTNIIPLAYRLYKYQATDDKIDELMEINKIGLNEIIIIKKDRKITYYI